MKRFLTKLCLKLAIIAALWLLKDQTKAKISQVVTDKIGLIYQLLKERQEQEPEPPAPMDDVPRRPVLRFIRRLLGLDR